MKKIVGIAAVALTAAVFSSVGGVAFAQGTAPSTELPRSRGQVPASAEPGGNGIAANGRCGGVSTGTGERRCGDASGGPADGNDTRN